MIKSNFLSPELTRLALTLVVSNAVVGAILVQVILGVCYAKNHELTREIDRSILESEFTK